MFYPQRGVISKAAASRERVQSRLEAWELSESGYGFSTGTEAFSQSQRQKTLIGNDRMQGTPFIWEIWEAWRIDSHATNDKARLDSRSFLRSKANMAAALPKTLAFS